MGFENKAGLNVNTHYGVRDTGNAVGLEHGENSVHRLVVDLTPAMLNGGYIPPVVVPAGAHFRSAVLNVTEAFVIGGTTPVVNFGAAGAAATDGITLTEAELEAVGTKKPASTGNGTWSQSSATGVTAATKVGVALGGTAPTVAAGVGKATLVLEYVKV